ncbi:MAG: PHB depolymerase family esterase [Isosphaeraceae bacterium]
MTSFSTLLAFATVFAGTLPPGDSMRTLFHDAQLRSYLVHVPPAGKTPDQPPLVIALHGAVMNGAAMAWLTGLNGTADRAGFVVAYPDGSGPGFPFLTWNAGQFSGSKADDVGFISQVIDDLQAVAGIDTRRVYVTGYSNGAMMAYRVASDLSDRVAAIAPVAGTMVFPEIRASRPVPVIHFHGTDDGWVPFWGPNSGTPSFLSFFSVPESISRWIEFNECEPLGDFQLMPDIARDNTWVLRVTSRDPRGPADVILYIVFGGGHTWTGRDELSGFFTGRSTRDISASDLIWEFFKTRTLPPDGPS